MKNLILTSLIITLLLVSVYTYADDEYESLLQEYMNLNLSEDNKRFIRIPPFRFKNRIGKSQPRPKNYKRNDEEDNSNSYDENPSENNDNDNTESDNYKITENGKGGFRIIIGGKSFNLCDPMISYFIDKGSQRFRKWYSRVCAASSLTNMVGSFSKKGKLKSLMDVFKNGLNTNSLDSFFGKRDFSWYDMTDGSEN